MAKVPKTEGRSEAKAGSLTIGLPTSQYIFVYLRNLRETSAR